MRMHGMGFGSFGFPLRELRGITTCGSTRTLSLIGAVLILLGATNIPESKQSPAKHTPTEAMRITVGQAIGILQDQELQKPARMNERVTRLKTIADSRFDYREMAKRSLGGQWDRLEEQDRQEFVDLFTELLTTTYVNNIHAYSGEEVTFLSERLEGNHAEVKSIMVGKKSETPLDYRLMMKGDEWKAYDVVVDGISLVRNYREQFAAILRSSSYAYLVKTLREKNAQYNVKAKTSETSTSSR
ncbi:MAG TPA: ABC transporter substrate-binding protein [Nitrospiraceae bacterium]